MALDFRRYTDGASRARILVPFHVHRGDIEYAIASEAYGMYAQGREAQLAYIARVSKAEAERMVRSQYLLGPPEAWSEMDDDEFDELGAAAAVRVAELWPE